MSRNADDSLGPDITTPGKVRKRLQAEGSYGQEQTLGRSRSRQGIEIDQVEVVDLGARYTVEGTLGQGGMGNVLLATDKRLGRKVAIKRILSEAAGDHMAVQRFVTEAKTIAALNHPNIVQIYEFGWAKDGPFLIMEYVDGGSLLDRCREAALPLDEAMRLAYQLCDGLTRAHELGIIHRDIKPANVLLTRDGIPKLTDFGLAKVQAADHGQTMTGAVLGTPDFMPPEQRRDAAEVDARSDVWSLAATIYQMVTGRSPKIIRFNDIPVALQEVLGKALEDRKDARYDSSRELRDALKNASARPAGESETTGPASGIADELQEGRCKRCGTVTSDLTKKFCRNPKCGASLRVACLGCEALIPVWDGVCGECGGNQLSLIESRRQLLSVQQAEAMELVAALEFDEALASVENIAGEPRPEFASFAAWAAEFIESTTKEKDRLYAAANQTLEDAQRHAAACDYPAAIHALETIPKRIRNTAVDSLLEKCRSRNEEADRLIGEIAGRIKRTEFSGLLSLVEQAAALRNDRKDLKKILRQLRERRDTAVARSQQLLDSGDLRLALAELGGIARTDLCDRGTALLERMQQAISLERQLGGAVEAAKADGVVTPEKATELLELCQKCLTVNPNSEHVRSLATRFRNICLKLPPLKNSIGIELKLLPAGTFMMGQAGGDLDESLHEVTLTRPFYLGIYEVTNAQWRRVMGRTRSLWHEDDDRPVAGVRWDEAVEFCRKLSALEEEEKAGRMYRLPTEAEWEYACRAGSTTAYSFGDDAESLTEYAWFIENSDWQTKPVGRKKPNDWGLYDMHGNVREWCNDWYGEYPNGAVTDPQGPSSGFGRVLRGGDYHSFGSYCRSARREHTHVDQGFRVALNPSPINAQKAEGVFRAAKGERLEPEVKWQKELRRLFRRE